MRFVSCLMVLTGLTMGCVRRDDAAQPPKLQCLSVVSEADVVSDALKRAQANAHGEHGKGAAANGVDAWVATGEAWLRMARVHSAPRYVEPAQDCLDRALALDKDAPAALRLRGLLLLDAHRFQEASALARRLVAQHPDDLQSWGTLSDAELELGNLAAALDAAQQMLDRKPNLLSYGRAAHLRWLTGDREGSKSLYRAAIRAGEAMADREPQAWMMTQAAWVFWQEGDYSGAQAGFALALSRVPDYVPALQGLGRSALALGDYSAAIARLERAQAKQPQPEAAWWLGDAYAAAGQGARAKAQYAEVERLAGRADPRTLALLCATQGRDARRGLALAKRAFEERPDVYGKDALAFSLYRAGELEQASVLARELRALGTPDARILFHAGLILKAHGELAEGDEMLARALALNPRFDLRLVGVLNKG